MNIKSRIGVAVGAASSIFCTLCLVVMPAFTASIILAVLVGIPSGIVAAALQARRTAVVTFMFALVPVCGFLAMENLAKHVGTGYVAFVPLVIAVFFTALALVRYSRARRAEAGLP